MEINNCKQRSPEWFGIKLGRPSCSNFDKIVTTKGEPSKQAQKYMYKLAGERVSGIYEESYQSEAMLRGIETESTARELYELITDTEVEEVGIIAKNGYLGSPDGLVGTNGIIEIKCPTVPIAVEYLINNKMVSTYFQQVQGYLLLTEREWCDFFSYYPGIKPFMIRVYRDEKFLMSLKVELRMFCEKLEEIINKIK